ncbi:MAG: hypothetical protein OXC07_03110 [Kistimonas sp.]|nr:hypothetical protein [Kistimonas sp.]
MQSSINAGVSVPPGAASQAFLVLCGGCNGGAQRGCDRSNPFYQEPGRRRLAPGGSLYQLRVWPCDGAAVGMTPCEQVAGVIEDWS